MALRLTPAPDQDALPLPERLRRRASERLEAHDLAGWSALFAEAAAEPGRNVRYAARCRLVEAALACSSGSRTAIAERLAQLAAVLIVLLEEEPREPVLLNHAGVAFYELNAVDPAEVLFEAARGLDAGLRHVGGNLAEIERRRAQGLTGLLDLPPAVVEVVRALEPRARKVAAAARPAEGMTLSLCMIVKDEEAMLGGCLAAVADAVDEIVVVDTGSTDRTVEIATSFGARVLHHEWTGDFAAARNVSFDAATSDWLLMLDADELLGEQEGPKLRALLGRVWREAFFLVETNHTGNLEDGTAVVHNALRLFRNRPEHRYTGRLHEQIGGVPLNLTERIELSDVQIEHFGYLDHVRTDKDKQRRNLELLQRQLDEGDDSPFLQFNLGMEHLAVRDVHAALVHLERSWDGLAELPDRHSYGFAPLLAGRLVNALRIAGRPTAAERADEVLELFPGFTDIVLEQGYLALDAGDAARAEQLFRTCLTMGDAPSRYAPTVGAGSFQAARALAGVLVDRDERDQAREVLEEAVRRHPGHPRVVEDFARVLLRQGVPATEVLERVGALVPAAAPTTRLLVARALLRGGAAAEAEAELRAVLDLTAGIEDARIALVETLLVQDRLVEAAAEALRTAPGAETEAAAMRHAAFATLADRLPAEPILERAATVLPASEQRVLAAWAGDDGAALDPEAVDFTLTMLNALVRLERFEAFERLVGVFERLGLPWRERRERLARLYLRRGFLESAADEWMTVIREQGPDPEALRGLAIVATDLGHDEDAASFAAEAERLAA